MESPKDFPDWECDPGGDDDETVPVMFDDGFESEPEEEGDEE